MNNTTVPLSPKSILNRLKTTLNKFKAKYPTDDEWLYPVTSSTPTGNLTDHTFYLSDDKARCGMAVSVAYHTAKHSNNNKELCLNFGSMLCNVVGTRILFKSSVETALNRIGIRPSKVVCLPYMAKECNIDKNNIPQLEWPSILVYFACCVLILFKKCNDKDSYNSFMSNCINSLCEMVGYDPYIKLAIPFDFYRSTVIKTKLGSCSTLCHDVMRFILRKSNWGDEVVGGVCQYLCNVLAWSEMSHFILINDVLVKAQSPVLLDHRVSSEVDDFVEACEAVVSHVCPQFYMLVVWYFEKLMVHSSKFPTLIAVAQELKRGDRDTNCSASTFSNSEVILTSGADSATVKDLVNLHRSF
ncbi:uncharacterized protein LOC131595297 [Vicia villosa]|uniref:uncharacterized protein LOC131595297 n=1 Tax=Vicia villosa TaxID=3911 RepID=UPI00273C880A|nr:uncharacterized protein LOC131595297 [Vicia villosa]XP_058723593.1 uncharacterized protein LOC131595297 [Vicia villosa]XP_058723594.1 uncharacterized protein LOC131595297 [Vicia villosa]XP_058723595.1 uncharacterized protein LOC131595297 [Vicia villosa]XP_058723596.1 uncharacterized protein LOC131595297 [Vicia villosa]XP_058723598.1 uncharacterized protein LOC131595297 [Vicia villosa]XP_058723599.1 uncharacterized protein LOC131595297 [Vicia villosa]XP_058723600.1 uncharacterized protein 